MPDLFIDDIDDAVFAQIEAIAKSRGITAEELALEAITEAANGWPAVQPEDEAARRLNSDPAA